MKSLFRLGLAVLALQASPLAHAWSYSDGDALLVLRKSGHNDVEYDLGSVNQFLGQSSGYITPVTGWDLSLATSAFNSSDLTGVKAVVLATTPNDTVTLANDTAWLSSAGTSTAVFDVTPSAWQSKLYSTINAVGTKPVTYNAAASGASAYSLSPSFVAAYDTIIGTPAASFGGRVGYTVEQTVPGAFQLWGVHPSTDSVKPASTLVGAFTLGTNGALFFSVGAVPAPTIVTPPSGTNINQGADVTLSVVATNDYPNGASIPLAYQWQLNGTNIDGATGSSLAVTNAQADDVGSYTVVVSSVGVAGTATSSGASLTLITDSTLPTVTIVAPKANAALKGTNAVNPVVVTGKATDNKQIRKVQYSLNGGAFLDAVGTTNWSVTNPAFVPGANTIVVKSIDLAGNESATATRDFVYTLFGVLTVQTNGNGAVSPLSDGKTIQVGKAYTLTAVPAAGWLFTNWTSVVNGATNSVTSVAKLSITGTTNQTLTASFVANRFLAAAGAYNGLFWDTTNGVSLDSAGFITVTVTSPKSKPGAYTGKLSLDGDKLSFKGTFALDGASTSATIDRSGLSKPNLVVQLQLDLTGGDLLSGSITPVGGAWTAQLSADRSVFNKTNDATAYLGNYTLAVPGATVDTDKSPGGDGFGTVTVKTNGSIVLVGKLGDGATFNQTIPVSKNGDWPLYVPAYKVGSEYQGAILGWVTVSNGLAGTLHWIKKPVAGDTVNLYPAGFTNAIGLVASPYTNSLAPVIPLTLSGGTNLGVATLSFGNLASPLTQTVALSGLNKFTNVPAKPAPANKLTLSVAVKTGKLTGSFVDVGNGSVKRTLAGVVLQNSNNGRGYFKGTSETGSLRLEGQ